MSRSIRTLREIRPLGVALAPAMRGCSDADLARSMANAVSDAGRRSAAGALAELRATFPDMPLSLRIAALHVLMRRGS
jgi:hypothetical protein